MSDRYDDLDALPADVRAMLRAERLHVGVPEKARARLAERLAADISGFAPPPPSSATTAPLAHGLLKAKAAKVLVALAVGGAAVAGYKGVQHASPSRTLPPAISVVAQEIAPDAGLVTIEKPEITIAPPTMPLPKVRPRASPPRVPAATLREEHRLLDAARDAIVRGEPEGALAPTASHAARFPRGVLAEERDALRIRALARLGRGDEARALLEELRAVHPHSFLLEGAAADVDAIP